MFYLDEPVVFSNTSETFDCRMDKILYGLDDNLSISFFIFELTKTQQVKGGLPRFAPRVVHFKLSSRFKVVG